jgi:hypothetical protein
LKDVDQNLVLLAPKFLDLPAWVILDGCMNHPDNPEGWIRQVDNDTKTLKQEFPLLPDSHITKAIIYNPGNPRTYLKTYVESKAVSNQTTHPVTITVSNEGEPPNDEVSTATDLAIQPGEMSIEELTERLHVRDKYVRDRVAHYTSANPDLYVKRLSQDRHWVKVCTKRLADAIIREYGEIPNRLDRPSATGRMPEKDKSGISTTPDESPKNFDHTSRSLAKELGVPRNRIMTIAERYRQTNPEWFVWKVRGREQKAEVYAPELVVAIRHEVEKR